MRVNIQEFVLQLLSMCGPEASYPK